MVIIQRLEEDQEVQEILLQEEPIMEEEEEVEHLGPITIPRLVGGSIAVEEEAAVASFSSNNKSIRPGETLWECMQLPPPVVVPN